MNLRIRHWLVENYIEISNIKKFSQEKMTGIVLRIMQDMEVRNSSPFDICTLAEVLELPLGAVFDEIGVFARLTEGILGLLGQDKPLLRNEATWLTFQIAYLQTLKEVLMEEASLSRVWLERALVDFLQKKQGDRSTRGQGEPLLCDESSWGCRFGSPKLALALGSPGGRYPEGSSQASTVLRNHFCETVSDLVASSVTRGQEEVLNLFANVSVKPLQNDYLQSSMKILREGKLTDLEAEEALYKVAASSFVQQINHTTVAWLVANSLTKTEAELIIKRLEHKLFGDLIVVVSKNASILIELQKFMRLGNNFSLKTNNLTIKSDEKIDLGKERYRASLIKKLGEPLLIESFSLKDIYVPLTGLTLQETHQQVNLMNWVVSQLEDLDTITVIESESGYGKTSFCKIFAGKVAQKFYPEWTPIFISLNNINYGETFQETLESAFLEDYKFNLSAWLEVNNHKCLLILDGLNELPNSADNQMLTKIFMQQLLEFQSQFRHKIILTSQSWTSEDILSKSASKLRRIQIQPWGQNEWKQWFGNWAKVQSIDIAQSFFTLLKKNKAFSQKNQFLLSDFVRQPLMLYLLGILHRYELLDDEILQLATNPLNTNSAVVLWEIYERLNLCLLNYGFANLSEKIFISSVPKDIQSTPEVVTYQIKNRHYQEFIDEIQAVSLQILCSGKKNVDVKDDLIKLPVFYFEISKKSKQATRESKEISTPFNSSSLSSLPNTLTIKFSHSQLGEYLCAKALVTQLKALTKSNYNNYGEKIFAIDSPQTIAEILYNLLGYGILTQEIEELVIEGLRRQKKHKLSFELLCSRLEPFWYAYCRGRWLDEGIAHKAWSKFKELQNTINVEQVNAAVGINIFLLLSACYRQTKRIFSPCGNPLSLREFNPQALIKLMAKTAVFHPETTRKRIGEKSLTFLNLSNTDFTQAMLAGVNLANTDLSKVQLKDACLVGANLADTNLTGADLTGANLTNANLTNAKLTGANLTGANLLGVNLDLVNLSNACLFQAIIPEAHKETAVINGAIFSLEKFEELQRLLSYQSQIYDTDTTEQTQIAFEEIPSIVQIESAEGEPILPNEEWIINYEKWTMNNEQLTMDNEK